MPGIHLYSSNRLEILVDKFAGLLQSDPNPPLQKETILVQSRGMARWLAMETASRLNIWANCDCPFPNTFIQNIYKLLLPDIPDVSNYNKEYSLWHIMAILAEVAPDPHFSKATAYLESGDDLKLYQLARETADIFDQYTLFRPLMILDWEENIRDLPADQIWQPMLWCKLVKRLQQNQPIPEQHRARLLQLFKEKIADPTFDPGILPSRISVFGISSLPPFHLRVLAALAHHIDLHFFLMNPCMEYWFDIIADRDIVKISRGESAADPKSLHLHRGNSLLASMGHLGRDFMAMLQELHSEEYDYFEADDNGSLLSCIQQDILYLRENKSTSQNPSNSTRQIRKDDTSITFHSCHSPMREVEILHDQLLDMFDRADADKTLQPRDVLVMTPDIDVYAPLIKAVFDAEIGAPSKIPYSISDQSIRRTSKYIETFLNVLSLAQSRFSSIEVMSILEAEVIRNRFNISESDLHILDHWLRETNICWGIDQDHKTRLQLPPYRENTWRGGLDRLLLGYALCGHDQHLFKDILPYDHMEGDNTNLLGRLLDFTETLFTLADALQQQHTLAEWSEILLQTQDKLLLADENTEAEERILHSMLVNLKEVQDQTCYLNKISLGVIRSHLINYLEERFPPHAGAAGFLTGEVTFCSLLPMRAIPFKAVYLLGFNDGIYPRTGRRRSFDLMALDPKRGDRSRRYDDRYLFLETLLSAREKLCISFVGQSIQDGSKRPPSVLVSELIDYIDKNYALSDTQNKLSGLLSDKLTTMHHLQPFHPAYFSVQDTAPRKNIFSYSAENCEAAIALQAGKQKIVPLFTAPLPSPPEELKDVELEELIRFFSHPARYILVKRLGIAPIEESRGLETNEPFCLQGLARYKLENDILDSLLRHQDQDRLYKVKKAAGKLPHGRLGKVYFSRLMSELGPFHTILAQLLENREIKKLEVDLEAGGFRLTGFLGHVSRRGLVYYRYGAMTAKDVIRSWISHLVLNSLTDIHAAKGRNTYYACRKKIYTYRPISESSRHLEYLLDLYWQGLSEPLFFFPNTSHEFAREIHKGKNEQEALRKASLEWEGNNFNKRGEKNDPYNLLCHKNMTLAESRFMETAVGVFLPALEHQEETKLSDLQVQPD